MANECKYYDAELDCCKKLSDWSDPMPILQPCIESPCEHYTKANEWISVKDRLPKENERVIASCRDGVFEAFVNQWGRWQRGGINMDFWYGEVTHWMPLPEPPKKEGADNG